MKVGFFVPDAKGRPQKNGESLAWLVQIPQGGAPDPAIQWGVRNPYKWPKEMGNCGETTLVIGVLSPHL